MIDKTGLDEKESTFEYKLEFQLNDSAKSQIKDEGTAVIKDDILIVSAFSGKTVLVPLRDILSIEEKDYRITLSLRTDKRLELFYLGYSYEEFLKKLKDNRNSVIKQDLLMHERLLFTAEDLEYIHYDKTGRVSSNGDCNIQISDTALIAATPDGHHIKFPLSFTAKVDDVDYSLKVSMETGDLLHLKMLGRQREPLLLNIEGAIQKLREKALLLCESFFGKGRPFINELALLFKDGRGVSKKIVGGFSPDLWPIMEQKLQPLQLDKSYQYLKSVGIEDEIVLGFKRGLKGELTGDDIWFIIPIKNKPVIAMEAGSASEAGGKATYFFRIPADINTGELIREINYCLFMINFRREPIYLTDEQIQKPAHQEYRYAIEKLSSLRRLRELFIGRIVHSSEVQWQKDVEEILC